MKYNNISDFLQNVPIDQNYIRPRIICGDGFSMSVQASMFHYCYPRDNAGPYQSVEIGFPSSMEPIILDYAEDDYDPTNTVYDCVPVEVVDKVLKKHGGII